MDAIGVIGHLLEEPQDDPLGLDPLEPYVGPLQFDNNVKDILEYARQLKEQAQQAGVDTVAGYNPVDIDRAFLIVAVQKYNEKFIVPQKVAKLLRKTMHFIWD